MRTNQFLAALAFTAIAGSALAAQSPAHPPAQPPVRTPAGQTPAPGAPYKPDFDIPRPEGPGGAQPKPDPAAALSPTEGYVIGAQDNLSIIVTDEPDFTGKFRVDTDGTISMPYLSR